MIVDYLLIAGIPFIDVGIGITEVDGRLGGLVRTTVVTKDKTKHVETTIPMVNSEEEAAYSSNIQIAELNALNACFAVIRWKKICGFYNDFGNEFNTVYSVSGGTIQACPVQYLCG